MRNSSWFSRVLTALTGLIGCQAASAKADGWQMNMYKGVTPLSNDMYFLHMVAIWICVVIGVIVFGVMIYSLIHHRKAKGHVPATFHDNTRLEIFWTIIPFLILVGLAVPATQVLMRMDNADEADVTVKIVGHQWRWEYHYLDQGFAYYSNLATPFSQIQNKEDKGEWYLLEVDKPVVLPVGKKIRFLVTSGDVIHSWWVPELGIKRDAIPGFMYEAWAKIEKPGVYRGQCAELCGINHGFMPVVVNAVPEAEFNNWAKTQKAAYDQYQADSLNPEAQKTMSHEELLKLGQQKYEQMCSACHQLDGKGIPPMYPALRGSSVAVGHPINRHIDIILNGVPGTAMQAFKDQMTNEEIAAVVSYERNAWANNTNEFVQPGEVATERKIEIKQPKLVKKAQVGGLQ